MAGSLNDCLALHPVPITWSSTERVDVPGVFHDGDMVGSLPTLPFSSGPFLHVMFPDPED